MVDQNSLQKAIAACLPDAQKFLSELIAIPSLSGKEEDAMGYVEKAFAKLSSVERVPLANSLREDRDYSDPIPDIEYDGRSNIRAVLKGAGTGRNLLLNTHIDTVPPAQGQENPFTPTTENGEISGRGACDAKGQAATIYLAMAALRNMGVQLNGDLIAHLVVEEENGGNGTLAMARTGEKADACVVLEPTECRVLSSIRGAVWFRITLHGKAGHSGKAGLTRSALYMAMQVVEILKGYHARLLAQSKGLELFDKFENPMPLTIGQLHAGNWPATAPSEAVLEGVLGFLQNRTAAQVMQEMTDAIRNEGGAEFADNLDIHFTYRHDASICPPDHELVTTLKNAVTAADQPAIIDAMPASCDAWFYSNQLDIPTVVFGGGSLGVAHSSHEVMPLAGLAKAAEVVAGLALEWCGGGSR